MSSLLNTLKQLAVSAGGQGEDMKIQFSMKPNAGENGFQQWHEAMKMVARLSGGIPHEFRKTLWLTLAERHISSKNIKWPQIERICFNDLTNPDDEELGVQIVKDLHRTGCSLFCGTSGEENQMVLKRVLLAYARWNKSVGYCQGFNMLAALILEVMDRCEYNSLKVMIYLIEGVLPESYFANSLRGLSVDMAVFRDLLRLKLPELSRHLEQLQTNSNDSGNIYEPPLTNVFTMQWFLTLFCNCLPHSTVLRVWDLIFLEGNQVLLKTALAIWDTLSDRIIPVNSADEFYSIMAVLTREMLEFGLMDANCLMKTISNIELPELTELRERYIYNITPWTQVARKGLRLFYSDDEMDDSDEEQNCDKTSEGAYGFLKAATRQGSQSIRSISPSSILGPFASERERTALDISALKKQYCKIRARQRQAQIIFTTACNRHAFMGTMMSPIPTPPINHLLLNKNSVSVTKASRTQKHLQMPVSRAVQRLKESSCIPGEDFHKERGETVYWNKRMKKKKKRRRKNEINIQNSCDHRCESFEKTVDSEDSDTSSTTTNSSSSFKSSSSTELCDEMVEFDSEDANTSVSESCSSPYHRRQNSLSSLTEDEKYANQVEEVLSPNEQAQIKPDKTHDKSSFTPLENVHANITVNETDREHILNLLLTTSVIAGEQLNNQENSESMNTSSIIYDETESRMATVTNSTTCDDDVCQIKFNNVINKLNKLSRTVSDTTSTDDSKILKIHSVDSLNMCTAKDCEDMAADSNVNNIEAFSEKTKFESALENMKIDVLEILFSSNTLNSIRNDTNEENEGICNCSNINDTSVDETCESGLASTNFPSANAETALQTILNQNNELLKKVSHSYTSYEPEINPGNDSNYEEKNSLICVKDIVCKKSLNCGSTWEPDYNNDIIGCTLSDKTFLVSDTNKSPEYFITRDNFTVIDRPNVVPNNSFSIIDENASSVTRESVFKIDLTSVQNNVSLCTKKNSLRMNTDSLSQFCDIDVNLQTDLFLNLCLNSSKNENDNSKQLYNKKKPKSLENLSSTSHTNRKIGMVTRTGKWISISIDNSDLATENTNDEQLNVNKTNKATHSEVQDLKEANIANQFVKKPHASINNHSFGVSENPYLHLNFDIIPARKKKKNLVQEYVHKKNVLSQSYHSSEVTMWSYNPFPSRSTNRPPKELGVKLGLYTSNKK